MSFWVAGGTALVTAASGAYSSNQSNKANKRAINAQLEGNGAARDELTSGYDSAQGRFDPVAELMANRQGQVTSGYDKMQGQLDNGINTLNSHAGELNVNKFLDPSRDFSMQQGQRAIEGSAAARGGLLSSSAMQNLTEYASGVANQNYNNAANLAMSDRTQQLQVGAAQANLGQAGIAGNNSLFQTGVQGVTNQANMDVARGENLGLTYQTDGNITASGALAKQDTVSAGINGGISGFTSVMGMNQSSTGGGDILTSDENLKEDIVDLTDDEIEEFLASLKPSEFSYTEEGLKAGGSEGRNVGVMAQDVENTSMGANIVENTTEGKKLDHSKSIGALFASVASLDKRLKNAEKK